MMTETRSKVGDAIKTLNEEDATDEAFAVADMLIEHARLAAQVKDLREALQDLVDKFPGDEGLYDAMVIGCDAELVAARAALKESGDA